MKIALLGAMAATMLTGCSTNRITEYDKDTGKITKVTETKESVVEQIIASTQNKSVFVFREAYIVGLRARPDVEKLLDLSCVYEHSNTGVASILKEHEGKETMTGIAKIMEVMKQTDSVAVSTSGIGSGSGSSASNTSGASGSSSPPAEPDTGKAE